MKRIIIGVGLLMSTGFYSCKKENIASSSVPSKAELSSIAATPDLNTNQQSIIYSVYNYVGLTQNVNRSSDQKLLNTIKHSKFINSNNYSNSLNLNSVTTYLFKEGKEVIIIPFAGNDNRVMVIAALGSTSQSGGYAYSQICVMNVQLNQSLTGTSTIDYVGGYRNSVITQGTETLEEQGGSNEFNDCMNQAYADICDGFVGCLAWYTNPSVALLAIAWCSYQTSNSASLTTDYYTN